MATASFVDLDILLTAGYVINWNTSTPPLHYSYNFPIGRIDEYEGVPGDGPPPGPSTYPTLGQVFPRGIQ